jgi:hypothetical protein
MVSFGSLFNSRMPFLTMMAAAAQPFLVVDGGLKRVQQIPSLVTLCGL